ncbi:MAG: hypothetical protein EA394_03050 [Bacteroidia bacterium]|nr:MAG: hypothetical protein EA394_03050 [Bacteroidia bacterium]
MSKLNIIINGRIVRGIRGETILEMSRRLGIEIPTLCNDDRLEPFSSCYLCVVEVDGMRGLQPACSTKITEGMRIATDNDRVHKSRRFALELLVSNHYADCAPPCREECPAGVDVQGYISMISKGKHREAVELIKETNPLPAICGRVCVRPCELVCRRNLLEDIGVGIDYLKRYTSDIDMFSENRFMPEVKPSTGKKVAIIGAGPGGLTAAYFLAKEGHHAEIFEASPHAGGMLRYGIPPYRLPNEVIEKEIEGITGLGAKIHYNRRLGDNLSYKDLKEGFDATILAIGSQKGTGIGCENDDAENIFSGIDFLRNMEMTGQKYDFSGKKVAVIGGGNTAMDCCRTAKRCGAEEVTVIYRRTEKEMPANPIEIHESKLEGINYMFLTAPARVNKDEEGKLKSLTCVRMELGEPDASGRRRPVKIDGSEFDVELDFILAAIGQKTVVNFMEDISQHAEKPLKLNRWGDIDAAPGTLQTSIENVFACGDGVTGPATLIEAIAQGRIAAQSADKWLRGEKVSPPPTEFLSKKDNFEKQQKQDYAGYFADQIREEMPTLDPAKRDNFDEVELGYTDEAAIKETLRCLECGCSELYTCDLKKYANDYQAEQKRFGGDYKKHEVNFDHPFVEIDNNKCILCSRCIRICAEVNGANALGLVNRGFETYVAPSMDGPLQETNCESCGLCIDTCPTGAITENVAFKTMPVEMETVSTVCNYCSVGCEINIHHKTGFAARVTGKKGLINHDGSICRYAKFGYHYLNDKNRITSPMKKVNGEFVPITFEEAYELIIDKIRHTNAGENGFYIGARLTNEEMYLIQKLARAGVKTNNVSSFHYMDRGSGYFANSMHHVPISQLKLANKVYILDSEVNYENAVPGYYMINNRFRSGTPLELVTTSDSNRMAHKADTVTKVHSTYYFVKSVIHYMLSNNMENRIYIDDHCHDFETYREQVLAESFESLAEKSGCTPEVIAKFAREFNNEAHAVVMYSEKNLSANTCHELRNLCFISGKAGKTASGLFSMKEKNNSQGLFDMGACAAIAPGGVMLKDGEVIDAMKALWKQDALPEEVSQDQWALLQSGSIKNCFIFGEDPLGCAVNKTEIMAALDKISFMVVQDLFMTETAAAADLILPGSLHMETGGSFTNMQKFIQQFEPVMQSAIQHTSFDQLVHLHKQLGIESDYASPADVMLEVASAMDQQGKTNGHYQMVYTDLDNPKRRFGHGCDYLVKRFDNHWEEVFST